MAEKSMDISSRHHGDSTRHQSDAIRPDPLRRGGHTFSLWGDMDRLFHDFSLGWGDRHGFGRGWMKSFGRQGDADAWTPNVEMFQRGNEFVVRAELPGLKKEDVTIDVTESAIAIHGERRREEEEERGGVFRSEWSYGSFRRVIPLPEGAITDQAKATFNDGVLEIAMPAPPEHVTRGRRLQITEEAPTG